MDGLNLATQTRDETALDKNIIISAGILLLVALLFVGLMIYQKSLQARLVSVQENEKQVTQSIIGGKGKDIMDFKNRAAVAESVVSGFSLFNEFQDLESDILPQVYLNSLSYDAREKTVSVVGLGDTFNTVAKQILSFKESGKYQKVASGKNELDGETGKIKFELTLFLK